MIRYKSKFLLAISFILIATSCSLITNTYISNVPNVQTCDSCKMQTAGYIGFKHVEAAVSVPIRNKIIIQSNVYLRKSGFFAEFGGGYYFNDPVRKLNPIVLCTFGYGELEDSGFQNWSEVTWDFSVRYQRINFIPAIELSLNKKLSMTLGTSFAMVNFEKYYFYLIDEDTHPLSDGYGNPEEIIIDGRNAKGIIFTPFLSFDIHLNKNLDMNFIFSHSRVNFNDFRNFEPYRIGGMYFSNSFPYFVTNDLSIGLRYIIQSFRKY